MDAGGITLQLKADSFLSKCAEKAHRIETNTHLIISYDGCWMGDVITRGHETPETVTLLVYIAYPISTPI